jgi:hypothetical protein
MIESYATAIEAHDDAIQVLYFKIEMQDDSCAAIKSDVCIGGIKELDEYLSCIRLSFLKMFPEWETK